MGVSHSGAGWLRLRNQRLVDAWIDVVSIDGYDSPDDLPGAPVAAVWRAGQPQGFVGRRQAKCSTGWLRRLATTIAK